MIREVRSMGDPTKLVVLDKAHMLLEKVNEACNKHFVSHILAI